MNDAECVRFLQWAIPQRGLRWPGFRKVRGQVRKRLDRRLRKMGLPDLSAYREYLSEQPDEWLEFDKLCRISISRFYRDRRVFDTLRDAVLPQLAQAATARGDGEIRVWSAGCASGEEAYTLRMVWEHGAQSRFPPLRLFITATDVDSHLLQRARVGVYHHSSVKDVPRAWWPTSFERQGDDFCVRDPLRDGIEFLQQDICQEQPAGPFDLILCRHLVLTYFDEPLQEQVLREILARLRPDGILVVGKQEEFPPAMQRQLRLLHAHSGIFCQQ